MKIACEKDVRFLIGLAVFAGASALLYFLVNSDLVILGVLVWLGLIVVAARVSRLPRKVKEA